jgi:hypothetical protein
LSARSTVCLLDYITYAEFLIFRNGFFCEPKQGIRHECHILPAANLSMSVESEWFLAAGLTIASRLTSRSFCLFKVISNNINYRSSGVSLSLVLSAGLYSLLFSSLLNRIGLLTHRAIMVYRSTYRLYQD